MKRLWLDRRTFIAFCALISLTILGLKNNIDVSVAIAGVAAALAGANAAAEFSKNNKKEGE